MRPFPTVGQAYAHVRREAVCQTIMNKDGIHDALGAVLVSKGLKLGFTKSTSPSSGRFGTSSKARTSLNETKSSHCGNVKHTRETCFKLHGYPDWWTDVGK